MVTVATFRRERLLYVVIIVFSGLPQRNTFDIEMAWFCHELLGCGFLSYILLRFQKSTNRIEIV